MSDIDDTLVHSGYGLGGPKFPKGVLFCCPPILALHASKTRRAQHPHPPPAGTILPGFVALLSALDARVAFVTARPEFIKHFTYKSLRVHYGFVYVLFVPMCGELELRS